MEIILFCLQEIILLTEITALILWKKLGPGMFCWDENEHVSPNL